jgi:hypothetical protein
MERGAVTSMGNLDTGEAAAARRIQKFALKE